MLRRISHEAQKEMQKTLLEFREGRLLVGEKSKIPVTSLRQALAIGRARARRKEMETIRQGEWNTEKPL